RRPPPPPPFPYTPLFRSEQRLLLTEEVLLGAGHDGDRDPAQPVRLLDLGERPAHRLELRGERRLHREERLGRTHGLGGDEQPLEDRKSTRLNSSHVKISY